MFVRLCSIKNFYWFILILKFLFLIIKGSKNNKLIKKWEKSVLLVGIVLEDVLINIFIKVMLK